MCLRKKASARHKVAKFRCKRCGAMALKKKRLCKPEKMKSGD